MIGDLQLCCIWDFQGMCPFSFRPLQLILSEREQIDFLHLWRNLELNASLIVLSAELFVVLGLYFFHWFLSPTHPLPPETTKHGHL